MQIDSHAVTAESRRASFTLSAVTLSIAPCVEVRPFHAIVTTEMIQQRQTWANETLDRMTRSAVSRMVQLRRQWRAPRHRSALR